MNKNTSNNFLMLAIGAAIGSVVTWKFLKEKYELIAKEEIESVKAEYSLWKDEEDEKRISEDLELDEDDEENASGVPSSLAAEYAKIIKENGYENEEKEDDDEVSKPVVISPEDLYDVDYPVVTLIYYADGVLTDDNDNIIEDIDDIVGEESLNTFGEYEDDAVYVRNDRTKCNYEILRDYDRFEDKYSDSVED